MKVDNRDGVDISQLHRSRRGDKAGGARAKGADDSGEAAGPGGLGSTANVEISGEAKSLAAANSIARADDTDEAKIARVKSLIHAGNYKPDMGKVADKVVNEHVMQELA